MDGVEVAQNWLISTKEGLEFWNEIDTPPSPQLTFNRDQSLSKLDTLVHPLQPRTMLHELHKISHWQK